MTGADEMPGWASWELERIGAAEEIRLTSRRPDGSLRPYVTMWVVRTGEGLYVRSDGIDSAYHAKYDRYGPQIVGSVTSPGSHAVTVRLVPQPGGE
jgi:hypothetical protein